MFFTSTCAYVLLLLYCKSMVISSSDLNPSFAAFQLETTLEYVLTNDSYNLYKLQANFYPKSGHAPLCVPVTFTLSCAAQNVCDVDDLDCIDEYNTTFLWTSYDTGTNVGKLLLAYALSGIMVKGFDWEGLCLFNESIQLSIRVTNNSCINKGLLLDALQEIATKVCVEQIRSLCGIWTGCEHFANLVAPCRYFHSTVTYTSVFIVSSAFVGKRVRIIPRQQHCTE